MRRGKWSTANCLLQNNFTADYTKDQNRQNFRNWKTMSSCCLFRSVPAPLCLFLLTTPLLGHCQRHCSSTLDCWLIKWRQIKQIAKWEAKSWFRSSWENEQGTKDLLINFVSLWHPLHVADTVISEPGLALKAKHTKGTKKKESKAKQRNTV